MISRELGLTMSNGGTIYSTLPPIVPTTSQPVHFPLQLLKQTSQSQEKISVNGLHKNIHVVVKNSPFLVHIGLTSNVFVNQILHFNNFTYDAVLVYDSEGYKGVDFVKVRPVDFKYTVNETGDQLSMELRIKVLTSQHENIPFRVKVVLLDPNSGLPFQPDLSILSEPVKVISKPEPLKKKPSNSRKRNMNDLLVETISRIEQQQKKHQEMIEKLLIQSECKIVKLDTTQTNHVLPKIEESSNVPVVDFEIAFKNFFQLYNSLPSEEKPMKIRKLIRSSSQRDREKISEFLDLFLAQGMQPPSSSRSPNEVNSEKDSGCHCAVCPYKKEVEVADPFYLFLSNLDAGEINFLS